MLKGKTKAADPMRNFYGMSRSLLKQKNSKNSRAPAKFKKTELQWDSKDEVKKRCRKDEVSVRLKNKVKF